MFNVTPVETTCSKCGEVKHPTTAYLKLCQHSCEPYVCKACREQIQTPPMNLGKLGWL